MLINFTILHVSFIITLIIMVIFLRNPIHALLCFIFSVINILSIFIVFEAEFVALVLFLVYIGAIAVLFLALIMFLNLSYLFYNNITIFKTTFLLERICFGVIFLIYFSLTYFYIFNFYIPLDQESLIFKKFLGIYSLSYVLYTDLYIFIILSGILLFLTTIISMIYTTLPKIFTYRFLHRLTYRSYLLGLIK